MDLTRRRSKRLCFTLAISILSVTAAVVCSIVLERRAQPVYEGKRIGLWFGDLCVGTYAHDLHGEVFDAAIKKISTAHLVFSRMDSNAVPYLAAKLISHSNIRETIILKGRKLPAVNVMFVKMVPPSHERLFAAEALRNMGTTAEASIPYLLKAGSQEENPAVKLRMLLALANAMGLYYSSSYQPPNLKLFEDQILDYARSRYPDFFSNMDGAD